MVVLAIEGMVAKVTDEAKHFTVLQITYYDEGE